jgi:outer membrane receptor protein involved in Fe transport
MTSNTTLRLFIISVIAGLQFFSVSQSMAQSTGPVKNFRDLHVTLSGEQHSLKEVFAAIEGQTRFTFVYLKDEVPLQELVVLQSGDHTLGALLEELARRLGFTFTRINDHIVVKRPAAVKTEKVTLIGTVRDRATNEVLVYANIVIDGTSQGTVTDANGRFSLELTPGSYTIRCAFVGYKTELVPVTLERDAELNMALTAMDVVLQDVTVFAHRIDDGGQPEVNALTLQSETIKHVTSIIPDVLRSVQMLPGVSTNNEFSSKFNVRGGNQDENLVVVNGTQVYDPFHFKEVSNASIGIFNADMIKKMDLITGGFTARYGDKMSSVLNIEYREGDREQYKGIASVSLMDFNALVEGPMGDKGSFIIGARKSYLEYLMKLVKASPFVHLSFYDIQGVFAYAPNPGSKILLKLIHSGDDFYEDPHRNFDPTAQWAGYDNFGVKYAVSQQSNDTANSHANYFSSMGALQYTQILSSDALIRSEVSLYDQRENENGWNEYVFKYKAASLQTTYFYDSNRKYQNLNALLIRTLEVNSALDLQIAPLYGIKTGASYQNIQYHQDLINQQTIDEFTNEYQYPDTTRSSRIESTADSVSDAVNARSYKAAGYLENVVQLTERLLVNAGTRVDYFDLNKDLTWSPRLNVSYNAGAGLMLRAAWGHYYQSPVYRQIAYSVATDTNTQSQHAVHILLGINYDLDLGRSTQQFLRFKLEGFQKKYDHLITAAVTSQGVVNYSRKNDAVGKSTGVDMQVIYSTPIFYGWISYGYLFAQQTSMIDGKMLTFPRYTDQRHTLAVTGEFDLGKHWSVNSRFVYGSGYPYTPSYAVTNPVKRIVEWIPDSSPNSQYLPAYTRVDLKIAKEFEVFGGSTSVFLDVSNLFDATNIQAYRYRFSSGGTPYREDVKLWPILPTFGIAVRF